jgi:hypothetical protein
MTGYSTLAWGLSTASAGNGESLATLPFGVCPFASALASCAGQDARMRRANRFLALRLLHKL